MMMLYNSDFSVLFKDDYETAERKIKKAEDTSNLDTEAPDESSLVARKRIRKQIKYSSDEETDSEIEEKRRKQKKQLPRPPLLSSCSRGSGISESCDSPQQEFRYSRPVAQYTSSAVSSCYSQPECIVKNSRGCDSPQQEFRYSRPVAQYTSSAVSSCYSQPECIVKNSRGEDIQTLSPRFVGNTDATPQSNIRRPTAIPRTRETLTPQTIEENCGPRDNKFICDSLKTLKEQMNQVLEWIRKQDRGGNNTYTALPDDIGVDLPLKSENDLEKLEVYIAEKNNFLALSSYLSTLGGRDFTAHTNSILKYLLSLSLATNLNFHGKRGQKRAIKELKLKDIVICSVRRVSRHISEREIEDKIKIWLKHASEKLRRERDSWQPVKEK
ncbi:protein of unknown function (DUF4806) [Popillia japonica]|uniref:DUF4806 domain-containing protein n=1 Tax=Popillia japonica TaxID=7064 RepID=A0AAW1IVH4_POPJA